MSSNSKNIWQRLEDWLNPPQQTEPESTSFRFINKANDIRKHRRSDINIKWKVFCYFAIFSAFMLTILWLFQIVLLDDFYKLIRTQAIVTSADKIGKTLASNKSEDFQYLSDNIISTAVENGVCVIIINPTTGTIIQSPEFSSSCIIHDLPAKSLVSLIQTAKENNNNVLFKINPYQDTHDKLNLETDVNLEGEMNLRTKIQSLFERNLNADNFPQSRLFVKIVKDNSGQEQAIFVSSAIKPIDATVQTLTVQLRMITFIMLVMALVLALLIAKRISNPIIKLNKDSKELAKGNYDIDFNCNGYREIVELGETLNETAKELGKTEKLQRDFIANVSHDLRTPLTMITGYAEVLRDIPGENTPENIQVIIDEANRLTTLVNGVLDISKLQSGTETLELQQYNLSENIRQIITRFGKLMAEEGYEIIFEHDSDVWVEADELKLSQVIYNLITNAITYTGDDKKITVKQEISKDKKQHKLVKISVIDTGEGIAQDKLKDIWQRYYKSDSNHKRAQIGTGLGLSIVSSVLEMHKANFGVTSTLGSGSNFWFELQTVKPAIDTENQE